MFWELWCTILICVSYAFRLLLKFPLYPQEYWASDKLRQVLQKTGFNWMSQAYRATFDRCKSCILEKVQKSKPLKTSLVYFWVPTQVVLCMRHLVVLLNFQSEWIHPPSPSIISSDICQPSQAIYAAKFDSVGCIIALKWFKPSAAWWIWICERPEHFKDWSVLRRKPCTKLTCTACFSLLQRCLGFRTGRWTI